MLWSFESLYLIFLWLAILYPILTSERVPNFILFDWPPILNRYWWILVIIYWRGNIITTSISLIESGIQRAADFAQLPPINVSKYKYHLIKIMFKLPFNLWLQEISKYFSLLQVRICFLLLPKSVSISCQHLKGKKVYKIRSHMFPLKDWMLARYL